MGFAEKLLNGFLSSLEKPSRALDIELLQPPENYHKWHQHSNSIHSGKNEGLIKSGN